MLVAAAFCGLAQMALAVTIATTTSAGDVNPPAGSLIMSRSQSAQPGGKYSSATAEIITMLDAKVDAQVVVAYIKNSQTPYQPDAAELIALKEHGATTEVQLALLNRGGELRQQYAQAGQQTQAAPVQAPAYRAPTAPTYVNPQETAYPVYAYPAYSYYDPYPARYYNYSYSYWPSFYWGIGFNWCWNNGRWCWSGNRNWGHVNNNFCWNGGNNTRFTAGASHAAFAPAISHASSPVMHSGGVWGSSGGMQFSGGGGILTSSGGARGFSGGMGHLGGRGR